MNLEAVQGAVIMLTGIGIGWASAALPLPRRRSRAVGCQCGHPRALHDPVTNQCHDRVRRDASSYTMIQCPCRQYVGPEPLPSMFHTGLELPYDES